MGPETAAPILPYRWAGDDGGPRRRPRRTAGASQVWDAGVTAFSQRGLPLHSGGPGMPAAPDSSGVPVRPRGAARRPTGAVPGTGGPAGPSRARAMTRAHYFPPFGEPEAWL
ncbi:hypothetical protein GCM10010149_36070 [Nonomuraea roseoviolacea subsp. roseoviolacea]